MSAPSGKPSPEGPRNSGNPQAMAIRDADDRQTEIDITSHTTSQTPSERSRSDKREVRAPLPPGAVMPQSGAPRFSHRGYDYHASREGMPAGSHHVQSNIPVWWSWLKRGELYLKKLASCNCYLTLVPMVFSQAPDSIISEK